MGEHLKKQTTVQDLVVQSCADYKKNSTTAGGKGKLPRISKSTKKFEILKDKKF